MKALKDIADHLQILQSHTQIAPPTPPIISVNSSKKWSKSNYPNILPNNTILTPPLPNYQTNLPLKFHPQFSYYTDGSFMKPKEIAPGEWRRERAGYGIHSPKGLNIANRLYGHQNILRAEMMAIHETLSIINTQYPNEPAFLFTDRLNVLYLLNTQIKHPTLHNSHPDQITLASMVRILQEWTQPIALHKVWAHVNIDGNEKTDKLAKEGLELEHKIATHPYEHAHTTPYYYQKDIWASLDDVPNKGPVRFLEKQIIKYDRETNLAIMATQTPNTCKWTENTDINNELSNEFWANPAITDKQKACLLKFRTWTYMGNARKQCFLATKVIPLLRAPYATQTNQIHGCMYYLHVNNNISTHFTRRNCVQINPPCD